MVVKTKKVSAKEVAKPSVTVETKKISNTEMCASPKCKIGKHCFMILLLVANTILLAILLINQSKMEQLRAGWKENYGLLKQVFQTEGYKAQQRQQLEQALQVLDQQKAAGSAQEAVQQPIEQPNEQLQ